MAVISMKQFLEAGVHFGHQTKRWHPKMSPYIYGAKNGVHVIDLRQTLSKLKEAYEYVKSSAEEGRVPLFVGTKTQIQKIVKEEADRCGCPYINFRWLGGLLTNFGTVKQSIARMKSFEELAGEEGNYDGFIKKEALMMERKRIKLERSLGGVRNMNRIPSILFITDCHREQLALKEAQKLGITVVGVSDTNCDPTGIDYVIPGNDDSPRAVSLYASVISTAVIEGLAIRKQNVIETIPEKKSATKQPKNISKELTKKNEKIIEKKTEKTSAKNSKKSSVAIKNKNSLEDPVKTSPQLSKKPKSQLKEKNPDDKDTTSNLENPPREKDSTESHQPDSKVKVSNKQDQNLEEKISIAKDGNKSEEKKTTPKKQETPLTKETKVKKTNATSKEADGKKKPKTKKVSKVKKS